MSNSENRDGFPALIPGEHSHNSHGLAARTPANVGGYVAGNDHNRIKGNVARDAGPSSVAGRGKPVSINPGMTQRQSNAHVSGAPMAHAVVASGGQPGSVLDKVPQLKPHQMQHGVRANPGTKVDANGMGVNHDSGRSTLSGALKSGGCAFDDLPLTSNASKCGE